MASQQQQSQGDVCLGCKCQGAVVNGYCNRHAIMKDIEEVKPEKKPAHAKRPSVFVASKLLAPYTPAAAVPEGKSAAGVASADTSATSAAGALSTTASASSSSSAAASAASAAAAAAAAAAAEEKRFAPDLQPDNLSQKTVGTFLDSLFVISNELEPYDLAEKIIQQTCIVLNCERSSLFYTDKDELVIAIAKGARGIRLPMTKGIAGWVATNKKSKNVPDAYQEPLFDSSHDKRSGFKTRSILAAPIMDSAGNVIAVLQCINKIGGDGNGVFTAADEALMGNLAAHCAVALRNAQIFEVAKRAENKVLSLLELVNELHGNHDLTLNSLVFTLTTRTPALVDADRCTLYLLDQARQQLKVMQGDVDIRIPLGKGIAGTVASTGQVVNIPDCYNDPLKRFDPSVDKKSGYYTKSMLCLPIFAPKILTVNVGAGSSKDGSSSPSSNRTSPRLGASSSSGAASPSAAGAGGLPHLEIGGKLTHGASQPSPSHSASSSSSSSSSSASSPAGATSDSSSSSGGGGASGRGSLTNVSISSIPRGMEVVGVLQMINRVDDTSFFTDADERVLQTLLSLAGPIISRLSINFFTSYQSQRNIDDTNEAAVLSSSSKRLTGPTKSSLASFEED